MLIDWFTVTAQVVNFLILIALLKHFLYGRILQTMEKREQAIAAGFLDAENKTREAERTAEVHRQNILEFEEQRHQLLDQANQEAKTAKALFEEEARREVGELRLKWRETLEQEKADFLKNLRHRTATEVCHLTRRALHDLANTSLDQHLAEVFVQKILQSSDIPWPAILESLNDHPSPLVVHSTFSLPPDIQHQIIQTVQRLLTKKVPITFTTNPDKPIGIELHTPGFSIGWSIDQYMNDFESNLSLALEETPIPVAPPRSSKEGGT